MSVRGEGTGGTRPGGPERPFGAVLASAVEGFRKLARKHVELARIEAGEATAIRVIAEANAAGVRAVAEAIADKGGMEAANLKVATQYVEAFANLAKTSNTLILPASAGDVAGIVATAMTVLDKTRQAQAAAKA